MAKGQRAGGASSSRSIDSASLLPFNAVASPKTYQRPSISVELCPRAFATNNVMAARLLGPAPLLPNLTTRRPSQEQKALASLNMFVSLGEASPAAWCRLSAVQQHALTHTRGHMDISGDVTDTEEVTTRNGRKKKKKGTERRASHLLLTLDSSTLSTPFHPRNELFTKAQSGSAADDQSLHLDNGFVILMKVLSPSHPRPHSAPSTSPPTPPIFFPLCAVMTSG